MAKTSPISIRMSRARRAGNTLTSAERDHRADGDRDHHEGHDRQRARSRRTRQARERATPTPRSTGVMKTTTIHDDCTDRPREARVEQPPRRHGRRQQQPQIVGQEERRERRDDAAEREEREEREEQPRQAEAKQVVAELLVDAPSCERQPVGAPEERRQRPAGRCRRRRTARARSPRSRRRARLRDDHSEGSRRYGNAWVDGCATGHQTTSSISCSPLPPVSFRNTGVSCSSSPPASAPAALVHRAAGDDAPLQDDADAVAHLLRRPRACACSSEWRRRARSCAGTRP